MTLTLTQRLAALDITDERGGGDCDGEDDRKAVAVLHSTATE